MKDLKIRAFDSKIDLKQVECQSVPQPGGFTLLRVGSAQKRIYVGTQGDEVFFSVSGRAGFGKIQRRQSEGSGAESDPELFVARFPGKVVKLCTEAGKEVKPGDLLLVMEAMKMEFSIKAPAAGTVTRFLVSALEQVKPGQKLLDFEAKPAKKDV